MARIKGRNSAAGKGGNGKVNPKAPGQTTGQMDSRYGKGGKSPAGGDASKVARNA